MISEFPIALPTPAGPRMVMAYVFTHGTDSHLSCVRELTGQEAAALRAHWPAYLTRRTKWLAWAELNLKPIHRPPLPPDWLYLRNLLDFQSTF